MTYPNCPTPRLLRRLAAGFVLVLGFAAPAAAVQPIAHPDHRIAVEGEAHVFAFEELLDNDVLDGAPVVFVVEPPAHGRLACTDAGCTYEPDVGWFGVDGFRYGLSTGGHYSEAEVEIWVSPLLTPLAGDWNGDGLTDVGWFHATRLDFHFATLRLHGTSLSVEDTFCARPALPSGAEGWIPLAGDWDGDGFDDVAVFDPSTRTFHRYDLSHGTLVPADSFPHPDAGFGGLPVAGDWDGAGVDEVGLFLPSAQLFRLLAPSSDGAHQVGWSFAYALPPGRWFPLASKLASSRGGSDLVAVFEPEARELRYRLDLAGGPTLSIDDYDQQGVGARALPFGGRWGTPGTIGLFDPDQVTSEAWRGAFRVFPCDFAPPTCGGSSGGNEPILLPIPEDPLRAVCVE